MGVVGSLLMAAVGAILLWAVEGGAGSGFDINTVGLILLIVGIIGCLISIAFWSSWGGFGGIGGPRRERETTTIIR